MCWVVSKLSSKDSSLPGRLLSVAKSGPAYIVFEKSNVLPNTILPLPLLVPLAKAVENFCLMSLTLSKILLYPNFIRPSLLSLYLFVLFVLALSFPHHLKMCFCWSKTFFTVFFFLPALPSAQHTPALYRHQSLYGYPCNPY